MRFGLLVAVALGLVACAPSVDTPAERQRTLDAEAGARLSVQLAALPGAWSAHATLVHPVGDPLAAHQLAPLPSAAILIVVDDKADRAAVATAAAHLVRGTAPEIASPEIVVQVGAPRAELAHVGPFTVERGSRRPLLIALGIALAAIAALALGLAAYARRGSSAQ